MYYPSFQLQLLLPVYARTFYSYMYSQLGLLLEFKGQGQQQ